MKGIPGSFSATAYYFGRQLRRELNVPVGLIQSALGGTAIAPWQVPQEIVQVAKGHSGVHIGMPGRQPPHALYNAMIAPWTGYAIRGAIWYQGESDCNPKGLPLYLDNMKTLVKGWRDVWGRSEESFPFYFVQLAPYGYEPRALRYPSGALPRMWAAQLDAAQAISNAAMAHTQDIGDLNNIHPANKQDVGARLARLALSRTYHVKTQAGRPITDDSGPEFKGMEVKGNRMVVSFNNAKSGLTTRDGRPPALFEVAGEDGKFEPAAATLAGETVVLTSDKVATPSQVRFGWSNVAEPNLMNGDKLPAASFRAGQGK
jgi:sialate O-acetylesterase